MLLNPTILDILWYNTHSFSLGLLGSPGHSELEPALLPLTPSAELDDSLALNTKETLKNSHVNPTHSPPDHMGLLVENPSQDFCMGLNEENNSSTFNINLLTEDPVDNIESSPCFQYSLCPENLDSFNFQSSDSTPSSSTPSLEGNGMNQDLLKSPSILVDEEEEDVEDEAGLPSPLSELLEDAAILDEIRLLDLALEEGFSPEMAARLEEEGYLDSEIAQQEPGQFNHNITNKEEREDNHPGSGMAVTEEQGQPRRHQQGN